MSGPSVWSYVFVIFSILFKTKADFTDVNELVAQSENVISQYGVYSAPANNDAYFENMTSSEPSEYGTFDFIIAGGGTAGLIVATRLIDANFSVLVIEAGIKDPDVSAILGWSTFFYEANEYSWLYPSTTQENACLSNNGSCAYIRGKVLGGCSSINSGVYVRGNAHDYDLWEEYGNLGWSYSDVLPYFKKAESARFNNSIDVDYHGFNGLQAISIAEDIPDLTQTILNAHKELGLEYTDYNGQEQLGYSRVESFLTENIRSSSNYSYLSVVIDRSNLNITLQSLVTKVIIENGIAVGVQFVKNGQYYIANASKEVILSGGTFGTPQILMLSGIGPASELEALGIDVVADLPVGKYLLDQVYNFISYKTENVYFNYTLEQLVELWTEDEGPLITTSQTIAFLDFNNDTYPDIEIIITIETSVDDNSNFYCSSILIGIALLHPGSVGELTLASSDPRDYPLINPNFLSEEEDIAILYKGIKFVMSLNQTKAFEDFVPVVASTPACDDFDNQSEDWWYCFIKQTSTPGLHPVGTAKMGSSANSSVVDSDLKVHGIENLRVVDASIMPTVNSGHTNAPTVMIAEKAVDDIILTHTS